MKFNDSGTLLIAYTEGKRAVCIAGFDRQQADTVIRFLDHAKDKLPEASATMERILVAIAAKKIRLHTASVGVKVKTGASGLITETRNLPGRVIQFLYHTCKSPNRAGFELMKSQLLAFAGGGPGGDVLRPFAMADAAPKIVLPSE